jgi:hypothetical protein
MLYMRHSFRLIRLTLLLKAAGGNYSFEFYQLLESDKFALGAAYVLLDILFELY